MALYPGAKQRHLSHNFTGTATSKDCAILHSTGSATTVSQYGWFNTRGANASSHFHVANDGTVEQYIDTAYMSWANTAANPRAVTIETQGDGTKPWTPAQVVSIVRLLIWACDVHGIPIRQMASSAANQKGIGWHRLGCDGNFPPLPSILAGRNQRGGQSWSSAYGKVCPGSDRIRQIPGIIAQVQAGNITPVNDDINPIEKDWFDMATKQELKEALTELIPAIALEVWRYDQQGAKSQAWAYLQNPGYDVVREPFKNKTGKEYQLAAYLVNDNANIWEIRSIVMKLAEKVGLTADEIKAAVSEAIEESVVQVDVNVGNKNTPAG